MSILNDNTTFEKERVVSYVAARMVYIVKEEVLSNFLNGKSPSVFKPYICVAKFLLQRSNFLKHIKDIDKEETKARTLNISNLTDGTFFSSWTEERSPLVHAVSGYVRKQIIHHLSHAPPS